MVAESGKIPGGSKWATRFDQKCRYDALYTSEVGNTQLQCAGRHPGLHTLSELQYPYKQIDLCKSLK